MRSCCWKSFIPVVVLVVLSACERSTEVLADRRLGAGTAASAVRSGVRAVRTLDDDYADLGGEIPGFAGMYFDSTGTLVVALREMRVLPSAREAMLRFLAGKGRTRSEAARRFENAVSRMRATPARFEFRELLAWYRQQVIPAVHAVGGVSLTGIDHRSNRIVVGVGDEERLSVMSERLARLPIPRSAVAVIHWGRIEETAAIVDTALTQDFRPVVPGGVQIARLDGNQQRGCTLGYNLVNWLTSATVDTLRYFVTAAHCTPNQGTLDQTSWFGQSDAYDDGGTEVLDPSYFTGTGCPSGRICYFADAALYRFQSASLAEQAKIAATPLTSVQVNGRYTVDNVVAPSTGQIVHLVGAISGRRYGEVMFPCADIHYAGGDNRTYLCQGVADYWSNIGDSGGPLIELHSGGGAWAVGITFARKLYMGVPVQGYFSPWYQIQNTFYVSSGNTLLLDPTNASSAPEAPPTPSPSTYNANISGATTVAPGMTCHWYGSSNIEDASYEWTVNETTVIGTGLDVYYEAPSSTFTLRFTAWNTSQGALASKAITVTVSSGAPQCYDQ